MATTLSASPVAYRPSVEVDEPKEAETGAAINMSMRSILDTTSGDYGHAVRSVHAKSSAIVEGEMRVLDGLPETLRQGLFERAATYPVVMRFSTNPGDILRDSISVPRGLALKVIGVEGDRLSGSEDDTTQDFVMANGPAFVAPDAKTFATNLKLLAATTDRGEGLKQLFSAALRGAETLVEAAGGESAMLINLGGQKQTHPLGESYFTQAAFRHGAYIGKFSVAPVSPELTALTDTTVDVSGHPDGLRETMVEHFEKQGGEWEVRVQLCTDLDSMPVEDSSVAWSEDESPYVAVARITVKPQPSWTQQRSRSVDDGLAFSPWTGLAAHRPLGSLNRLRKETYELSSGYRAEFNGCPIHEPRAALDMADGSSDRSPRTGNSRATSAAIPTDNQSVGLGRIAAGTVGGLAGGALISAMMLAMEAKSGEPSDLIKLERRTADKADLPHYQQAAQPTLSEQLFSHAGHLALGAAAGTAYGALKPKGGSPILGGLALGLGFYTLAYGVVGPLLGVTKKLWDDEPASIAQHAAIHAVFGVATAVVTDRMTASQ